MFSERLSPDEFGCPHCGNVDRTDACIKGDGSCVDFPLELGLPHTNDELLAAWARLWHDLWIDGDLQIAAAIPEALAKRGHELQRKTDERVA